MHKKIIPFIFSSLGVVSLFLPYSKTAIVGCGKNYTSTSYYYDRFIKIILDSCRLTAFSNVIELLFALLVCFSLVFSSILFSFNRTTAPILLITLTLLLMVISFFNLQNDLGFGYYVIVFQQIILLFYIVSFKNKFIFS